MGVQCQYWGFGGAVFGGYGAIDWCLYGYFPGGACKFEPVMLVLLAHGGYFGHTVPPVSEHIVPLFRCNFSLYLSF